jgi:hypothetical protein
MSIAIILWYNICGYTYYTKCLSRCYKTFPPYILFHAHNKLECWNLVFFIIVQYLWLGYEPMNTPNPNPNPNHNPMWPPLLKWLSFQTYFDINKT